MSPPVTAAPNSSRRLRLAVVQGPVQALTACTAIHHAEQLWGAGLPNLMLFGGILADDTSSHVAVIRAATLDCGRGVDWAGVLDFVALPDARALAAAVAAYGEVAEIVCGRNVQRVNEVALQAFPQARRITVGDGFGVLEIDPDPARPQFDVAMPLLPTTLRDDALGDTELVICPGETMLAMLEATRRGTPGLIEADAELARFAQGGALLLMNYLTEAYGATVHGEIALSEHCARAALRHAGQPVVIKPHPRSSLGQTAALARRLRAGGHPVRIMGQYEFGQYPIEAFRALVSSVEAVHTQGSSSAFSLHYLYGIDPTVTLPRRAARRTLLPREFARITSGAEEAGRFLAALDGWDGRTPMRFELQMTTPVSAKLFGRLTRPITYNPLGDWRRRRRPWRVPALPDSVTQALGTSTPRHRIQPQHGIVWLLDGAASVSATADPAAAVPELLARLEPGSVAGALVAVRPSTHAPGWLGWWRRLAGIPTVDRATLTAEETEDLLETGADVLMRVPETGRTLWALASERLGRRHRLPAGWVAFVFRVRAPAATAAAPARPDRAPVSAH